MAGVAIVGLDQAFAVRSLVLAVMTAEAAWPILVADIIRVGLPRRLHLGEKIMRVDFLDRSDGGPQGILPIGELLGGIALRQSGGDAPEGLGFVRVRPGQNIGAIG